ncbi:MAG TPA: PaaI family thioesterase [Acidimicrobiia bacterium]|nr:PaaI family thioesterase [Acidimicrobiia bacterium]
MGDCFPTPGMVPRLMPELPDFPEDRIELTRVLEGLGATRLPGLLGLELVELGDGRAKMRCVVEEKHLASNGYLHAASVIALADTTAGYGCVANLPEGAVGFTTIELKSNHLGTLLEGALISEGTMAHGGRTTQVWDVVVSAEDSGKKIALFRCTQMLLYS